MNNVKQEGYYPLSEGFIIEIRKRLMDAMNPRAPYNEDQLTMAHSAMDETKAQIGYVLNLLSDESLSRNLADGVR